MCRSAMLCRFFTHPLAVAALVTLANAAKPVTVDDTAYLAYARHIAEHPFDPYGFTIFWWAHPEPAMQVLCPPVVPYWLAAGMRIMGDSPVLLKLWLFPFVGLLAWALRALLVRFARVMEHFALPLLMLSPAVLPTVNLMLDIPAVALALASVELFARVTTRRNGGLACVAGVVAAIAMQTKYTAFVAPAVLMLYGLTHRRAALAGVAVGVCLACFAAWEWLMAATYGHSHFLLHASGTAGAQPEGASRVTAFLADKRDLIPPLVGHFGCLAVGVGLLAGAVLRVPRRWLIGAAVVWCVGFALICLLPRRWLAFQGEVTAATVFWQVAGWCWLAAVVGCGAMLQLRVRRGLGVRLNATTLFLIGWLAIEVSAALVLTPFPAARRVIGVTLVAGLVAARAASRVQRVHVERKPPKWVLVLGIAAGVAVASLDTLDAFPEKACTEHAAELTRDRPEGSTVWFVGHWGFQYYCERAGMKPLIPRQTVARAGDFVVIPAYPDDGRFHRPYAGFPVREPRFAGELIAEVAWDDWLSAQTVPSFYGGLVPVSPRDGARLRVRVYRLRTDWVMGK